MEARGARAAGAAQAGARAAGERIAANRAARLAAEALLNGTVEGELHAYRATALGGRFIDIMEEGENAHEVKVGYTAFTASIRKQVAKDVLLMQRGAVDRIT